MSIYKSHESTPLNEVELSPTNSISSDHLKKEDKLSPDSPSASSTSQFDLNSSILGSGFQSSNSSGNSTENQALQSLLRDKIILSNGHKKIEKEISSDYIPPLLSPKSLQPQLGQQSSHSLSSASFPSSAPRTNFSNSRQQFNQSNSASFSGSFQLVNESTFSNFEYLSKEPTRQHHNSKSQTTALPHATSSDLGSEIAVNQNIAYISNHGDKYTQPTESKIITSNIDVLTAINDTPVATPTNLLNPQQVFEDENLTRGEVNGITIHGDEDSGCPGEEPQPTPEELRQNAANLEQAAKSSSGLFLRLVFCFIAVTIAWASSMSVARFFAETIVPAPQWAFVSFRWKTLRNVMVSEGQNHLKCIDQETSLCRDRQDEFFRVTDEKMASISVVRHNLQNYHTTLANTCERDTLHFVEDIQSHAKNTSSIYMKNSCTAEDRKQLESTLGIDVALLRDEESKLDALASALRADGAQIARQIDRRTQYDKEYFGLRAIKLQDIRIQGLNFLSEFRVGFLSSFLSINFENPLRQIFGCSLFLPYGCTNPDFINFLDLFSLYAKEVFHVATYATTQFQRLANIFTKVVSALNYAVRTLTSVIPRFLMPDIGVEIISVSLSLPSVEFVALSSYSPIMLSNFKRMMSVFTDFLQETFRNSFQKFDLEFLQKIELELDNLPSLLADYNPPPINFELNSFSAKVTTYQNDVAEVLRGMRAKTADEEKAVSAMPLESEATMQPQVTFETFKESFPTLEILDMDFGGVVEALSLILSLSVTFDIIQRVIKSINIIRKYLKKTETVLPPVDMVELHDKIGNDRQAQEQEHEQGQEREQSESRVETVDERPRRSFPLCFLRQNVQDQRVSEVNSSLAPSDTQSFFSKLINFPLFLIGPIFSALLIAVFLSIGVYYTLSFYIQFYRSYEEGCLKSTQGSFTAFNVHSIASKISREPGDLYLWEQNNVYDATGYARCQSRIVSEDIEVVQFRYNRTMSHYTFDKASNGAQIISRCVDPDLSFPDGFIHSTRTGTELTIPFSTVDEIKLGNCAPELSNTGIWQDEYEIPFGTAGCHDIRPACRVFSQCSGPNAVRMHDAAMYASCDAEWLFHSSIFRFFFFVIIFISFSVSRSLFSQFLAEYFWEGLNYNTFRVISASDLDGNPVNSLDQASIKTQIKAVMKSFKTKAVVKLIISVLIHIPYLVVIAIVNFQAPPYAT